MAAYYNEIDPFAAAWLRELIKAGHITPGEVDERSIEDVVPNELAGFSQCHFFAGIGGWSRALRNAGWPDDRQVWTGSCPCQPFSAAGKRDGFADERRLWPAFFHLIEQLRPSIVIGEQVASKDTDVWIDLVQADLEAVGYAFGCVPFPAAGIGSPHIRERSYWVADANQYGCNQGRVGKSASRDDGIVGNGAICGVANSNNKGLEERERNSGFQNEVGVSERRGDGCGVADDQKFGRIEQCEDTLRSGERSESEMLEQRPRGGGILNGNRSTSPTNGLWRDVDWLFCRDGKLRPVEPGTFPLVAGAPARVGRLRGYGNSIVVPQAQAFIEAFLEA